MPNPSEIKLHQQSRMLEVNFDNGMHFNFPCEYLRVYSPSAEVRGHGVSEGKLVLNKQNVNIAAIEPVGHYAIKLIFDDGHDSGIYTWEGLYDLGVHYKDNWQRYLDRVAAAAEV